MMFGKKQVRQNVRAIVKWLISVYTAKHDIILIELACIYFSADMTNIMRSAYQDGNCC